MILYLHFHCSGLLLLFKDKIGSHFFQGVVSCESTAIGSQMYQVVCSNSINFQQLAVHKHSNFVVQSLITSPYVATSVSVVFFQWPKNVLMLPPSQYLTVLICKKQKSLIYSSLFFLGRAFRTGVYPCCIVHWSTLSREKIWSCTKVSWTSCEFYQLPEEIC